MRKRELAIGGVSLVGVIALVVGLWPGGASAQRTRPQTLTFIDKTVKETNIDNGAQGFSAGDESMDHDVLFQNGQVAGKLGVWSAITNLSQKAQAAEVIFTAGMKIQGGTIAFAGRIQFSQGTKSFKVPIVGGTGDFETARGYGVVEDLKGNRERLTVYLIP
jgi:hypothetical protein